VPFNAPILVNGQSADLGEFRPGSRVLVDVGGSYFWLRPWSAVFGEPAGRVTLAREDGLLTVSIDLLNTPEARVVRWPETAGCIFLLSMLDAAGDSPEERDQRCLDYPVSARGFGTQAAINWRTPSGTLGVVASLRVGEVAAMDAPFRESLGGMPVRVERLSDEKLVG
jgi:hypothetical protein